MVLFHELSHSASLKFLVRNGYITELIGIQDEANPFSISPSNATYYHIATYQLLSSLPNFPFFHSVLGLHGLVD